MEKYRILIKIKTSRKKKIYTKYTQYTKNPQYLKHCKEITKQDRKIMRKMKKVLKEL